MLVRIIEAGIDGDRDAAERDGHEHPAQGVDIRHERQEGGLGLGEDDLRHLDTRGTQLRHPGRPGTLHGAAVGQHLAYGRSLDCKCGRTDRKTLAHWRAGPRSMCMKSELRVASFGYGKLSA